MDVTVVGRVWQWWLEHVRLQFEQSHVDAMTWIAVFTAKRDFGGITGVRTGWSYVVLLRVPYTAQSVLTKLEFLMSFPLGVEDFPRFLMIPTTAHLMCQ